MFVFFAFYIKQFSLYIVIVILKFENQKLWFIHSFYKYWSFNTEISLGSELAPLFSLHRFPGDLLRSHNFKYHLYADSQFTFLAWLLLLKPPICISNCFLDIPTQMSNWYLKVYMSKRRSWYSSLSLFNSSHKVLHIY